MKDMYDQIQKALNGTIGKPDVDSIRLEVNKILSNLPIQKFDVKDFKTAHQLKNLKGRIVDWFKWKTPLKRVFYKPYYVQKNLTDVIGYYYEFGSVTEEQFVGIKNSLSGIKVWDLEYPENPYSVVQVNFSFVPIKPLNYISVDFEVKNENSGI